MIDDDFGLDLWAEAGEKTLIKRKNELEKFRQKLLSPMPPKKKIKPNVHTVNVFNNGDLIAIKLITKNKPYATSAACHRKMSQEEFESYDLRFTPPAGNEMYMQIKNFYEDLKIKEKELNPIELAAWTHAEFVRIHPFVDGNGRTSRLIMNYQLLLNGYLPVSVAKENRLDYYNALEQYAVNGDLTVFADFVAELEEVQLDEYMKLM